jgi:cell division septum initiation protein DivIVA
MATGDAETQAADKPAEEPEAKVVEKAAKPAERSEPFARPPVLGSSFRGYDRAQTDGFLQRLEDSFHKLTSERDALRTKAEEAERRAASLETELAQHRERQQAVADALITAQSLANEVRAAAEQEVADDRREAATAKGEALQEAAEIRAKAQQEAAELLRDARTRADRLIDDVQRGIREQQHEAEHLLDDTKERLGSLVRDLLSRLEPEAGSAPAPGAPDD